jgi:hypothetical protein
MCRGGASWAGPIGEQMTAELVLAARNMALQQRQPEMASSDRRSSIESRFREPLLLRHGHTSKPALALPVEWQLPARCSAPLGCAWHQRDITIPSVTPAALPLSSRVSPMTILKTLVRWAGPIVERSARLGDDFRDTKDMLCSPVMTPFGFKFVGNKTLESGAFAIGYP